MLGFDCRRLAIFNGKVMELGNGTESKANSSVKFSPEGAYAGLFIGEVKGLITMP
jgi:hypothetical protein